MDTQIQILKYNYTNTTTQIQIYKYVMQERIIRGLVEGYGGYGYTNSNTQIQIHKYNYTNTNTQIRYAGKDNQGLVEGYGGYGGGSVRPVTIVQWKYADAILNVWMDVLKMYEVKRLGL